MGFRGEALASIAAVAQVELKTKRKEDNSGVLIEVENSSVVKQEPVAFEGGTSLSMKNLFFNVPARRNFLKSIASELRHIIEPSANYVYVPRETGVFTGSGFYSNEDRVQKLAELRAKENEAAASYGWVDQEKGVVRLPLDRAAELTLQRYAKNAKKQ